MQHIVSVPCDNKINSFYIKESVILTLHNWRQDANHYIPTPQQGFNHFLYYVLLWCVKCASTYHRSPKLNLNSFGLKKIQNMESGSS